ncbi:MAG: restriction endonuclease [Solirubrobacteraceae bacterium]
MPKRTNTFQEVVSIIHGDLAGDATREDSAMLTNRLTGQQREVDVVLRAKVAGHETVIAIEATSRRGPVTAPRGESMVGKHANPPTDELVLVSESGFTKQARALAEAENVAAITPEDISGDDSAAAIMEAFPSLKPKTVDSPITTSSNDLTESLDLASVSEDADLGVEIRIEPPFTVGGKETGLRARYLEDGVQELHQIDGFLLNAKAQVRVSEIKLTHKQLADLDVTTPTARAASTVCQRWPLSARDRTARRSPSGFGATRPRGSARCHRRPAPDDLYKDLYTGGVEDHGPTWNAKSRCLERLVGTPPAGFEPATCGLEVGALPLILALGGQCSIATPTA